MKLVAWNVNGVRARLDALTGWIDTEQPDVLLLQETKAADDKFPAEAFTSRGYHLSLRGSAPLNGVAILSKQEAKDVVRGLPGEDGDLNARWIEATVGDYRVASLYLPNGTSVGSDAFAYKLRYFDRIGARMTALAADGAKVIVGGDWNVAPEPADARSRPGRMAAYATIPTSERPGAVSATAASTMPIVGSIRGRGLFLVALPGPRL